MTATAKPESGAPTIDPRRLLIVVAPHPDDEVIGFGAAIYDHVVAGGRTLVVAVSDGGAFDDRATQAERSVSAARRQEEQIAALAVLGVHQSAVVRVGLPDGAIAGMSGALVSFLCGLLIRVAKGEEPIVVVPWRHDGHPDHEATAAAVLALEGTEAWEVPIWSWRRRHEADWTEIELPISEAARAAKRAAIRCHRSQLTALPGGRPPVLSRSFVEDFDRPVEIVVR